MTDSLRTTRTPHTTRTTTAGSGGDGRSGGGRVAAIGRSTAGSGTGDDVYARRVAAADWEAVAAELDAFGCALLPRLLTARQCAELASRYDEHERFRSTVDMRRHRFGSGEYRYFAAPFPEPVQRLREELYPRLLPVARDWYARLGREAEWPGTLDEWLEICHRAGQRRPTPFGGGSSNEGGTSSSGHNCCYGEDPSQRWA